MIDDPIVQEVRNGRQAYAASLKGDVHAIATDLRRREREAGRTPVRRAPRRPELTVGSTR